MRLQARLLMMLRQAGADEGWWRQVVVIGAKSEQALRLIYHSRAYPQHQKAYEADLTKAIGDIMVQCYIVAAQLGKPIEEMFGEAIITFRDEMANIVKKRGDLMGAMHPPIDIYRKDEDQEDEEDE